MPIDPTDVTTHWENAVPTIRVELFEGRSAEQKRQLAQALTEAVVSTLGGSADGVDILFYDIARQNWATGGVLWSDRNRPAPDTAAPPDNAS